MPIEYGIVDGIIYFNCGSVWCHMVAGLTVILLILFVLSFTIMLWEHMWEKVEENKKKQEGL